MLHSALLYHTMMAAAAVPKNISNIIFIMRVVLLDFNRSYYLHPSYTEVKVKVLFPKSSTVFGISTSDIKTKTCIAQSGRQWVPHRRKGWFSTVLVQVVEVRIHSESTCDFLHARQRKISKIATYVEMSRLSVLACRSRRFCLWRSL